MKKNQKLVLLSLNSILLAGCTAPQMTLQSDKPYPTAAYIAKYNYQAPGGAVMQQTWYSDGKGKLRLEVNNAPGSGATVIDYPNKSAFAILDQQKLVMKLPFDSSPTSLYVNSYTAKEQGLQELGAKNISGHQCHGWKLPENRGGGNMWVEDGTGMLVESAQSLPNGEGRLTLIDSQMQDPSSTLFVAPANYKVLEAQSR